MCHIQGDHEIPCLYVQDRCWYVDRTLAFPSSCLLCFEEDLVYHRLSAGCAVFMEGHLSKSKRVFRRVVASSRNQGVVADSIESFLNYSECAIITVAGLAFRDLDWLISLANHEVIPHS